MKIDILRQRLRSVRLPVQPKTLGQALREVANTLGPEGLDDAIAKALEGSMTSWVDAEIRDTFYADELRLRARSSIATRCTFDGTVRVEGEFIRFQDCRFQAPVWICANDILFHSCHFTDEVFHLHALNPVPVFEGCHMPKQPRVFGDFDWGMGR